MVPPDAPVVPIIQYNLARPLVRRYLHTRQKEDVSKAIDLFVEASERLADDNPVRQMCSKYLHFSHLVRDAELERSIEQDDLHVHTSDSETSIETLAHQLLSEGEERYQHYKVKLDRFSLDFDSETSLQDLNSIIQFHQRALNNLYIVPFDPLQISNILLRAGNYLCRRASTHAAHERADIDGAIDCFQNALKLPMTNRCFVYNLCFAGHALLMRFGASGQREDLDQAVNYAKRAAENIQSQDTAFAFCMRTLGAAMRSHYEATGKSNRTDLDIAIDASLWSVNSKNFHCPTEDLPTCLMGLVSTLQLRHQRNGELKT